MSTGKNSVFGTGIMLAMLLAPFAGFAQETAEADDDLMPAVDTSAVDATSPEDRVREEEIDTLQPGVDSTPIVQDITRRTTGNQVMDFIHFAYIPSCMSYFLYQKDSFATNIIFHIFPVYILQRVH